MVSQEKIDMMKAIFGQRVTVSGTSATNANRSIQNFTGTVEEIRSTGSILVRSDNSGANSITLKEPFKIEHESEVYKF